MITLYTFPTPNGWRASILLEEMGLEYQTRVVDLAKGEQLAAEFLAVNPLGKIPALVEDGAAVFGSTAILYHLAEKYGKFLPTDPAARRDAHVWLAFAAGDLGPNLVSAYHLRVRLSEPQPIAIEHFSAEIRKCHQALETRLAAVPFLAGNEYSIADIACFPFIAAGAATRPDLFVERPNLRRWHDAIAARPAVQRGMAVPKI